MIKTFKILQRADSTWTGAGVTNNELAFHEMDEIINGFIEGNKKTLINIHHSFVNENIQIGSSDMNTQRNIYLVSTVVFV